jgi:hypothetical protein
MNAVTQHEMHPDAERLNAFAEQALRQRERAEVLEHLAVCGRCRRVVALAQEAAKPAGLAPAAAHHAAIRPRASWRSWGLALAPAAALAVTAAVAVYVHVRNVEQNAEMAKVEAQRAAQYSLVVSTPARPEQPQAAPPTAPAMAGENYVEPANSGAGAATGEREHKQTAEQNSPFETADRMRLATAERTAQVSSAEGQGPARESETPVETPAASGAAPAVAAYQEEQRKQSEAEAAERHTFAAKAAVPASQHGAAGGAEPSTERVVVTASAPVVEMQTVPITSFVEPERAYHGAPAATRMMLPIHLPSGQPAVSIASSGSRILVIDQAGTLFLSEDSAVTWEAVTKQWTGRAVVVRRQAAASNNTAPAPAAETETAGKAPVSSAATSQPVAVFEILNDQSLAWLSTDGKTWIAK